MFGSSTYKKLAFSVAAAGALTFTSMASAAVVDFRPGTADQPQVDYSGFGDLDPDLSAGSAAVALDQMNFIAYGNNLIEGTQNDTTWSVDIDLASGTFTETFTFVLVTSENTSVGSAETSYGNPENDGANASYVTVVADLQGRVAVDNSFPGPPVNMHLIYEDVAEVAGAPHFDWYFWDDGVASNCGGGLATSDADCVAGFFGSMDVTGSVQTAENDPGKSTLAWSGSFNSDLVSGTLSRGGVDLDETGVVTFTTNTVTPDETSANSSTQILEFDSENNTTIMNFQVPEPSALGLMGIGILGVGLAAIRRRRQGHKILK
jgi:hypothetical protein